MLNVIVGGIASGLVYGLIGVGLVLLYKGTKALMGAQPRVAPHEPGPSACHCTAPPASCTASKPPSRARTRRRSSTSTLSRGPKPSVLAAHLGAAPPPRAKASRRTSPNSSR